jgi:two-component system phosphate regulon sensor histidine kinase PhoR
MGFFVVLALIAGGAVGWFIATRITGVELARRFHRYNARNLRDVAVALTRELENGNRLQGSLHEAQTLFQSLLQNLPVGVVILDTDGRVTHINDRATDLVGSRVAPLGRFQWEVIRSAALATHIQNARRAERRAQATFTATEGLKTDFVRAIVVPLPDPPGGTGIFLEDVKPEEEWRRRKEDMIQALSHELKTPVTVIAGYMDLLTDAVPDEALRAEIVRPLQQAVDTLKNLITGVMTLYRLESTPVPVFQRVALADLAAQVEALLGPIARQRDISLQWDLPRPDPILYGSPSDLFQMLLNLVQNAIIYNRPRGSVAVSARKEGSRLLLEVRDTGIGISAHDLPRIFERFYRVERGRSRENGGTGLGLAIVKHIVEKHSGEVSVESRLGEGSVFRVHLPLTILDRDPETIRDSSSAGAEPQSREDSEARAAPQA